MSEKVNWADYLTAISNGAPGAVIAKRTGVAASTISRWLSGENQPLPKQAADVARALKANPIEALVAAGYLSEDDVTSPADRSREIAIRDFTDLELAREAVRRIEEGSLLLDEPLNQQHPAMQSDVSGTPEHMSDEDLKSRYDLAANETKSTDEPDLDTRTP